MRNYSFRAECRFDVEQAIRAIKDRDPAAEICASPDPQFPDVDVELHTSCGFLEVANVLANLPNGHVMFETLAQCALGQNPLERVRLDFRHNLRVQWAIDGRTGHGEWHHASQRSQLVRAIEDCNRRYGAGTHWLESQVIEAE